MITRRPLLWGAAASALIVPAARAQSADDFVGEWNGALDLGSQRLRLRMVIAAGPTVTMYSVDQGNGAFQGSDVRIDGTALVVLFPAINASYRGTLSNGRIEGQFTQGGTLPLVFTRGEAAAAAPPSALTQAQLDTLRTESGAPGMGAAAANSQGARVNVASGLRCIGRTEPITTSDQWHLGSITKSMTATLIAKCAEAGVVSWDDTVGGVLGAAIPEMRAEYRDASFRHLCSHRAGLQANIDLAQLAAFPRESADARADRIAYARLGLMQAPVGPKATTFTYSNTGYVIAGAMLETKLNATWESLIQRQLFEPLRMASAGQGAPGAPGAFDQPIGHAPGSTTVGATGASASLQPYPPGTAPFTDNPAALGPAGRVHANFEDVLKYLAAHRDRASYLRRESWDLLHTPPFGGPYAMGWQRRGDALWHNGSNTLWYAEVMFDRTSGCAAVAAANDGRAGEMGRPVGTALLAAAAAVTR
ncbi:serine hydrolase domain-containing protein [Terricaulis sp.]|uniref:serine hydrolase domain-containing protein n=1 Tax=Terricaulis sp. TaxID=2768686 RepID=UPI0037846F2A